MGKFSNKVVCQNTGPWAEAQGLGSFKVIADGLGWVRLGVALAKVA